MPEPISASLVLGAVGPALAKAAPAILGLAGAKSILGGASKTGGKENLLGGLLQSLIGGK